MMTNSPKVADSGTNPPIEDVVKISRINPPTVAYHRKNPPIEYVVKISRNPPTPPMKQIRQDIRVG
jgi:hypothetical protein